MGAGLHIVPYGVGVEPSSRSATSTGDGNEFVIEEYRRCATARRAVVFLGSVGAFKEFDGACVGRFVGWPV